MAKASKFILYVLIAEFFLALLLGVQVVKALF